MLLTVSNLSKSYIHHEVLNDINFRLNKGDKVGLIGINGAGKSTLFKLLTEEIYPDKGQIFKNNEISIGYLEQNQQYEEDVTLLEAALSIFNDQIEMEKRLREMEEDMSFLEGEKLENHLLNYHERMEEFQQNRGYTFRSEVTAALKGLGFSNSDFERKILEFSGGEKSRIELARLILKEPDLLLLDEPTNHLDIGGIEYLENFIKDYKKTVLIISHDRYFLDKTVTKIFHLENKHLKVYDANYSEFTKQRKKYVDIQKKMIENQQREIERQEEIIERFKSYGNERLIRQGQSRQKMLDKMKEEKELVIDETKMNLEFKPSVVSGRDVLFLEDVSKSFGEKKLFEQVDFKIYRGDKIGLIGPNGVGKSTLFKIILGELTKDSGNIFYGEKVELAYFDQEQDNLHSNKTVLEEFWALDPQMSTFEVRSYLARVNFVGDRIYNLVGDLSGGERSRLSLLKMMLTRGNTFLLDEPTNHLDIDSKEILEESLVDYEGTLLVISHDRYFLNKVVDRIIVLNPDGTTEYLGNYDYYIKKSQELEEEQEVVINRTQIQKEKRKEREILRKQRALKKEIKELEEHIIEWEEKIEGHYEKIQELFLEDPSYNPVENYQEIHQKEEELAQIYEKWEELEMELEE